jgi:glycerol uptake facilitator-like aquaporin
MFGATVASVMLLLGRLSGAHINPAITLSNGLAGGLKRRLLLPYIVFQVIGSLLAGLSLKVALGSFAPSLYLGSTKLAAGISPIEGIGIEAAGTSILALAALSASTYVRTPLRQAALVGSTLFFLIMFIGPMTGASFNPARSLGPSVFSGYFDNQLVYWVGPLAGAGCAGLIFGTLKKARGQKRTLPVVCVC